MEPLSILIFTDAPFLSNTPSVLQGKRLLKCGQALLAPKRDRRPYTSACTLVNLKRGIEIVKTLKVTIQAGHIKSKQGELNDRHSGEGKLK